MNKNVKRFSLTAIAVVVSAPVLAGTTLAIKGGLKGSLNDNVEAYVSAIPEDDYSISIAFANSWKARSKTP